MSDVTQSMLDHVPRRITQSSVLGRVMAGIQVHDDDEEAEHEHEREASQQAPPTKQPERSNDEKIPAARPRRKSVAMREQSDHEYARSIKHRRASVVLAEAAKLSPTAWLACIVVGLATGVADGAMIRILMELFRLKDKLLQWTTAHVSLGTAFITMLGFCLPLAMIAATMVM